jgi:hypothetical protein
MVHHEYASDYRTISPGRDLEETVNLTSKNKETKNDMINIQTNSSGIFNERQLSPDNSPARLNQTDNYSSVLDENSDDNTTTKINITARVPILNLTRGGATKRSEKIELISGKLMCKLVL